VVGSRCDGFYLPDCRNLVLSSLFSADGTVSPSMRRRELIKSAAAGLLVTTASDAAPILSTELKFPTDFAWGVSTSALQIEGSLAADGRGPSIWDNVNGGVSRSPPEPAASHYRLWHEDIRLLQMLGVSAYRYSIAWPRLFPKASAPLNEAGLAFYDRLTDAVLSVGVEPWVCLHHWDLPEWVQQQGGWIRRDTVERFLEYARTVVRRLGDRVRHWIPLNEPNIVAYAGYGAGVWPPKLMNEEFSFDAVHHENLAIGRLCRELRQPGWQVGPVLAFGPIRPASGDARDVAAAELQRLVLEDAFLGPILLGHYPEALKIRMAPLLADGDLGTIHRAADFIGINYYGPMYRRAWPGAPFSNDGNVKLEGSPVTDGKIVIDPEGLGEILRLLRDHYDNPPVVITENGAAFDENVQDAQIQDQNRIAYLRAHLQVANRELSTGSNLRGYFVWTLLDDWEWTSGYDLKYGLVHVNFETGDRRPKSSFDWYSSIIRSARD